MMSAFLHFLLNAFIILGSLGGCLAAVALVVFNTRGWTERIVRGLAIFAGTLVVTGAAAAGLTFPTLSNSGPVGWTIRLIWVVLGAAAGALLARYLISRIDGGTNLQIRVMILVTIIAHVELLEIYAQNLKRHGFVLGTGALPDIAFISGLVLYVVFRYDTGEVRAIRDHLPGRAGHSRLGRGGVAANEAEPMLARADQEDLHIFREQSARPREPRLWA